MADSFRDQLKRLRVSPRSFAFFSLISVFAPVFGDFDPFDSPVDVGSKILLGLIATTVLALFLWPVLWLVFRSMSPGWVRFSSVLAVLVTGGVVRGLVVHELGPMLSFDVGTTFVQRVGNSVTTTVVWLVVLSLFTHATDDFRWRYSSLMRQLFARRAASVSSHEVSVVLGEVQADLRGLPLPTSEDADQVAQMEMIAQALRTDVLERIRSHSRELWVVKGVSPPRLRVWPVLRLAISRLDYSLGFVLGMYGLLGLGNLMSWVSFTESLVRVGLALIVLTLLHGVYQRYATTLAEGRPWVNALYLLSLGIAVLFPMGFFEFFVTAPPWGVLLLLLLPIPTATLVVIQSTLNLSHMAREQLLEQVSSLNQAGEAPQEVKPESRSGAELASYLHNSLQSEIQSIIVALEGASTSSQTVALGEASLERLRMLSTRSLDEDFESFSQVPLAHLDKVIDGWRGILEIDMTWDVAQSLNGDSRIATVVQIIQEVASNAVVHAGATQLDVNVVGDRGDFVIRISANAGRVVPLSNGMGTDWLESFIQPASDDRSEKNQTTLEFRV